jgi:hypothetical protein
MTESDEGQESPNVLIGVLQLVGDNFLILFLPFPK